MRARELMKQERVGESEGKTKNARKGVRNNREI